MAPAIVLCPNTICDACFLMKMSDDDLEHLLSTFDVSVEATAVCEIERGLRLVFPPSTAIEVHYVLAGTLHLTLSGSPPVICGTGSLIIVPSGVSQSLAADRHPIRDIHGVDHCSHTSHGLQLYDAADGRPGDLRLFCGVITSGAFGLLDRLVKPIKKDLSDAPIVRQAFAAMLNEIGSFRLGTRAVVGTLMKFCLMKAIQSHLDKPENRRALLASLRSPHLQRVVAEVRANPGATYDLESLAALSGMSRSAFAREFLRAYGVTPMRFVTTMRLYRAAELLRFTAMPVKMIAGAVGFASRSHFSHAFRGVYGIDPTNFRLAQIPATN